MAIEAGLDGHDERPIGIGIELLHTEAVRNDEAFKPKLTFQDLGDQLPMGMQRCSVPAVVGGHDRQRTGGKACGVGR